LRREPLHFTPARTGERQSKMAGLFFEQFSVGQTFVHEIRRTVTYMDNILFSSLTFNPAGIHIDHEYAKGTEFGKPLMNSMFTLGLIIGLSVQDTTLGTTVFQSPSYPRSDKSIAPDFRRDKSLAASRLSCASPAVRAIRTGRPLPSTTT
jgi:MaoC like domain